MPKRILAVLCFLLIIPSLAPAQAYDPCVRSAPPVDAAAYPPPDVPECARVEDSYFDDAVLIGCSIMTGLELSGNLERAEFVARIGMSPKGAMSNRNYQDGNRYLTMAEYAVTLAPAKLYIMLGSNGIDIKFVPDVLREMNELLNYLIVNLPDTLIYLISIPPVTPKAREKYPYLTDSKVADYNLGLRELAAQHGVYYLDVYSLLVDGNGQADRKYAAGDGYHLQLAGYALVAEYLYTHALPIEGGA